MLTLKPSQNVGFDWRLILRHAKGTLFSFAVIGFILVGEYAFAQARVDLEDLDVKGELLKDNRMRMTSRESTRIQDRVRYRKNFRPEIIDGADVRLPASEPTAEPAAGEAGAEK